MDIKLLVALIGLAGIGLSALVQFYLGSKSEKSKKVVEVRTQAYVDLLNVVAEIAGSAKYNESRKLEQLQKLTQAKTRVVLIGSEKVVAEVHGFFFKYGCLNSKDSISSFSRIVAAMREDLSGSSALPKDMLTEALFGKELFHP